MLHLHSDFPFRKGLEPFDLTQDGIVVWFICVCPYVLSETSLVQCGFTVNGGDCAECSCVQRSTGLSPRPQ